MVIQYFCYELISLASDWSKMINESPIRFFIFEQVKFKFDKEIPNIWCIVVVLFTELN